MPQFKADTIQVHIARFNEIFQDYEFLILKRSPDEQVYPNIWQVVTGRIEEGEVAFAAAIREVTEETGLVPSRIWTVPTVTIFFNAQKDVINHAPVFGFLVSQQLEVEISNEHSEYKWLDLNNVLNLLALPSHKHSTEIFYEYCLKSISSDIFEVKL